MCREKRIKAESFGDEGESVPHWNCWSRERGIGGSGESGRRSESKNPGRESFRRVFI